MKILLQIFYDILLKIKIPNKNQSIINKKIVLNYLTPKKEEPDELITDLCSYFEKFYYFCFELDDNNMLKGQINFKF